MARNLHVFAGHVELLHLDICILSKLNGGIYLRQHVLDAVFLRDVQREEADLQGRRAYKCCAAKPICSQ